ncbi:MAG: hypothetical protein ABGX25_05175 [Nautiliaceae bacterium]
MQIFSKLQRNSVNYLFVKSILFFILAAFNGSFLLVPFLVGFVFVCEELGVGVVYILFFSLFHSFGVLKSFYLFLILFGYRFVLKEKIEEYVNKEFRNVVSILSIYIFLFPLFLETDFIFTLLLYNFLFDLIVIKVVDCVQE